ncbi:uncharacterized protein THITE_2128899 [Thermothielavioides terrestris NRRL 8126]|uniref:Heterokaryon incompatibility domain-containing protein n=1 Tax=Thermothielavioides terrestris (strain ATCC 38088 / NRRL 8126) TaxID=578455 RepID=G2R4G7_THETT|nr:uncharacterized protein THITE_2128899 [Thermothielavioides terrestris NRRL 8126]AEO66911.1 hypothetical protein THITE_2128899 [Thermothielavioides terrestris NRRL 8126]
MDAQRNKLCKCCQGIPFDSLPFESEPGIPHQHSLAALRDSASSCPLCHLILRAVNLTRKKIERGRKNRLNEIGGIRAFHPDGEVSYIGMYNPGTCISSFPEQGRDDEEESQSSEANPTGFADDRSVRPWLFGNWWKNSRQQTEVTRVAAPSTTASSGLAQTSGSRVRKDERLLLIGLGVRLAPTPQIRDAEGNETTVHHRGTFLRLRTDDGIRRIRRWARAADSLPVGFLPSRVLDVETHTDGEFDGVKLVETGGRQRGRYIALSHCWGSSQSLTTTRSTIAARRAGVVLAALPKTYRDAVAITRALGVRYLWIDSLCIVQDDPADWEREAARMASVYGDCYLTIAASCSTGDDSGCFPDFRDRIQTAHPSPDERSVGMVIQQDAAPYVVNDSADPNDVHWIGRPPFVYMDAQKGELKEYLIPEFGCPLDPIAENPLNTRAWTLQERLLSPCTLHLCRDQMYWESELEGCISAEDGSRIRNTWFHSTCLMVRESQSWPKHGLPRDGGLSLIEGYPAHVDPQGHGRWNAGWLGLIENYSKRKMTRPEDKLPALSGVASLVARETKDTYYAGLWKSHMLEDLAWRVCTRREVRVQVSDGFDHEYREKLCDVVVPAGYRAPSWSWASLDAHIQFVPLDFARLVAEFLYCHVELAGQDPYGKVCGGRIRLWAPLVEVL